MRTDCGCIEIKHEPLEFEITGPVPNLTKYPFVLPNTSEEDWCRLKNKIIFDFQDVVKKLECGIQPDIELLLEEISILYMNSNCGFGVTKKMYASDPEEDYFLRHSNLLSEFNTQEEKDQVLRNLGIYNTLQELSETTITAEEVESIVNSKINPVNTKINNSNSKIALLESALGMKIGYVFTEDGMCYGFSDRDSYNSWVTSGKSKNSPLIIVSWQQGKTESDTPTPTPTPTTYNTYYKATNSEFTGTDLSSFQSTASKEFQFGVNNTYFYIVTAGYTLKQVIGGTIDILYNNLLNNNPMTLTRTWTSNGITYKVYEFHSAANYENVISVTCV